MDNNFFKIMKGLALKHLGRKKEGNAILRDIELRANDMQTYGYQLHDLGSELVRR